MDEQPWQEARAGQWPELETTLSDLSFVETKCAAGMAVQLAQDYQAAAAALPATRAKRGTSCTCCTRGWRWTCPS